MKTTTAFRFIIAAMAAIAVFSSCRKELANESAGNATDGIRVISVQFDNSTKAVFGSDGLTPKFVNNDKIRVSNSQKSEECTVTVSGTSATFTTTLSGTLTAIYPANAAVLASEAADAPIASSNNFKVLATQTGKVEDAIIAKATIADSSATFTGVTSLFEIAPPSGATSITITSLNKIDATTGRRSATANAAAINTTGADDVAKREITVSVVDCKAYVSLVPGVKLTDLSFDAGEAVGLKGIPASKLGSYSNDTAPKAKYTINNENWHPYVVIGGKKWATENIGATASNPYGTYFEWGNTTGHALKEENFGKTGYINSAFESNYEFSWANCPFQTASSTTLLSNIRFTKYLGSTSSTYKDASATDADARKTVLDLADDAAYANWGGPWRMPTGGTESNADFTALAKAANASYTSNEFSYNGTITTGGAPSSRGVYFYEVSGKTIGVYFVDSLQKKLFFPGAGMGFGTTLCGADYYNHYQTSSLNTANPYCSYLLYFDDEEVYPQRSSERYSGYPVRPVSD